MQPENPGTGSRPPGNTVGLVLKLALVVSLIALVASVATFFRRKTPEETPVAGQTVTDVPEVGQPATSRRPFAFRGLTQTRPVQTRPVESAGQLSESRVSNAWATLEAPPRTGFWVAPRLPELHTRMDDVFARLEPPVFYQVPLEYGAELSNRLAEIRTATNDAKQFFFDYRALSAGAARDHKDYVQEAKSANARRRAEASVAMKKLTDLQALYLERKREFQLESARLKPLLEDPPAQFEAKLLLFQKAATAYKNDIDQLETAIHTLQKQNLATVDSLNAQDENIEKAYELSAQDVIGQLNVLSNRVQSKLGEVNAAIRDYNDQLTRYGSLLPARQ